MGLAMNPVSVLQGESQAPVFFLFPGIHIDDQLGDAAGYGSYPILRSLEICRTEQRSRARLVQIRFLFCV
jgi:hypothetical protein